MPKASDEIRSLSTSRSNPMESLSPTKTGDTKDQPPKTALEGKSKKRRLSALSETTSFASTSSASTLLQEEAKCRRMSDSPSKVSASPPSAWKEFCKAGAALFNSVAQKEALQTKDSEVAANGSADYQQLVNRIEKLEEAVRHHHQFVEQHSSGQNKMETPTAELIRSSLAEEFEKINSNVNETVEAAKTVLVIRADDIEHEISNIRTTALELHALDLKIAEVRNELCRRLDCIERNQKTLPEIVNLLKDIQTQLNRTTSDSSSSTSDELCVVDESIADEDAAAIHPHTQAAGPEDLKEYKDGEDHEGNKNQNSEPQKPSEKADRVDSESKTREEESGDKKIRKEIAETSKSLTRLKHEIFSLSHRIEEERRKAARQPNTPNQMNKLKMEKYGLLEREEYLKRKERELKLKLYEWTKRPTYRPKSRSGKHSRRPHQKRDHR
ncbi:hypothetical protein OSTOST_16756 [Ostertagia ostertagi]